VILLHTGFTAFAGKLRWTLTIVRTIRKIFTASSSVQTAVSGRWHVTKQLYNTSVRSPLAFRYVLSH